MSETTALKNKIVNMDRIVSQFPASTESLRSSLFHSQKVTRK